MTGWLRRAASALLDALVERQCPYGPWRSSSCYGCALDRQWLGSRSGDHAPSDPGERA